MSRRAAGEWLPDDSVTSSHADLMPELGEELALLAMMERARHSAEAVARSPDLHARGTHPPVFHPRTTGPLPMTGQGARSELEAPADKAGPPVTAEVGGPSNDIASAALSATGDTVANIAALLDFRGYAVVREIHRGGQGVVYEALQKSTSRPVAVKVLHQTPSPNARDLARFEREVLILGLLKHPNLVAVHDSGSAGGRHFLVMDLVEGRPLHEFEAGSPAPGAGRASGPARDVRAALRRFVKICDAVNAAHLRGIIHRDLKPGNILVDEAGEPRVLDFGLAKIAEGGDLSQLTMTADGQFVGSLPWASPEQASGATDLLDIRSDVYSLGVILFQVLAGRFPYPVEGHWRGIADHIAHTEPVRPRSLRADLAGDLENIVLKCLAKDAARRYQSAGELRDDVLRFLAGEPVAARADSTWYVVRKLIARHRLAAALALAIITLTAGAAVVTSVLYQRERTSAEQAEAARAKAQAESAKLKAVNNFLNDMLAAANPEQQGKDVKVVELLESADTSIEDKLGGEPLVEAAVRSTIGETYMGLGLIKEAEAQFRAARDIHISELGPGADETVASTYSVAVVLWMRGALEEAEALLHEAFAAKGLDSEQTELNDNTVEMFRLYNAILNARGRFEKTVDNARRVLDYFRTTRGPTHHHTISAMNSLAFSLDGNQREDEAEPIYREALTLSREHNGPDHPLTQSILASLANLLRAVGRPDEARPIMLEALESRRRTLAPEHPGIGDCLMELAGIKAGSGELEGAVADINEAVRIHRASLGDESWRTAGTRAYAASIYLKLERFEEAEGHAVAAFDVLEKSWGEHRQVENGISGILISLYEKWDKPDKLNAWRERIDRANAKLPSP